MNYRLIILLLALVLIIATPFIFFKNRHVPQINPTPKAIKVETSPVTLKMFASQFETLGDLASMDSIDISSEISGQIVTINFQSGHMVKKGDLLIQLDNTILKSELASAQANLALTDANFHRISTLATRKLISAQALDQALAELQEKKNTVTVKRAQLNKLSLYAPFSGTLGAKTISIGQYITAGQPLVHLVSHQTLKVEYQLPERLLARLHLGQSITVLSDAYPNQTYHGVVNYIAPAIDRETRTIALEAVIDNSQHELSSGLFVRIKHQLGEPKKRLLVPEESLIPTINGQKIFVLEGDKAITKRINIGCHYGRLIEITQGLNADDIVIVRGQHKLKEGSLVLANTLGSLS